MLQFVIIISKRDKYRLLLYSIITNRWKTILTTIPIKIDGEIYLLDDGRLFALGMKDNEDFFLRQYYNLYNTQYFPKSGYIFDANINNWTPIQQMHKSHSKSNIVQIGSLIYVVRLIKK